MSTLSLADLGPKMRRELGLEVSCRCGPFKTACTARSVAMIPVVEIAGPSRWESIPAPTPGGVWLRTGLHRLRIPPNAGRDDTASHP